MSTGTIALKDLFQQAMLPMLALKKKHSFEKGKFMRADSNSLVHVITALPMLLILHCISYLLIE